MSRNGFVVAAISVVCLFGAAALSAADKAPKKLTCCEEAISKGKECAHKCCVMAHNRKESCAKCNPGKEDLKALKTSKGAKKTAGQAAR